MTKAVAQLVDDNFGGPEALPLMHRQARWLFVGRLSYWLFVYAVLALIALAAWSFVKDAAQGAQTWTDVVRGIGGNLAISHLISVVLATLLQFPLLIVWLVGTLVAGLVVDAHLDATYSDFWHKPRLPLRNALGLGKHAREDLVGQERS